MFIHDCRDYTGKKSQKFHNGQILLPDCVHTDTLQVIDGEALTRIFSKKDAPATDGEISEVLYKYCKPITKPKSLLYDYQINLHNDTVWVYDNGRFVGSYINTKWDSQLDSILLKDNQ
jgi:hypothetical protein